MIQRDPRRAPRTSHQDQASPSLWVRGAQLVFAVFIALVGTGLIVIGATGAAPPIMIGVGICFYGVAAMMIWAGTDGWVPDIVARHRVLFGVLGWLFVGAAGGTFLAAGIIVRDDDSAKALIAGTGLVLVALWGIWKRLTQDPPTVSEPARRTRP